MRSFAAVAACFLVAHARKPLTPNQETFKSAAPSQSLAKMLVASTKPAFNIGAVPSAAARSSAATTKALTTRAAARNNLLRDIVMQSNNLFPRTEDELPENRPLPWYLDYMTYGGVVTYTVVGCILSMASLPLCLDKFGVVGTGVIGTSAMSIVMGWWTWTYILRVGNKDTTYTKQLKAYEEAVIQKRYESLSEDEMEALKEEIIEAKRNQLMVEQAREKARKEGKARKDLPFEPKTNPLREVLQGK